MDRAGLIYRENKAGWLKPGISRGTERIARGIFRLRKKRSTKKLNSIASSKVKVLLVYIHLSRHPFSRSWSPGAWFFFPLFNIDINIQDAERNEY